MDQARSTRSVSLTRKGRPPAIGATVVEQHHGNDRDHKSAGHTIPRCDPREATGAMDGIGHQDSAEDH